MQVLNLIAAIDINRCIGKSGPVPLVWKQKEDMTRFKKRTSGNVVIMGYNTFKTLGKPLPNRINIVVTKKHHHEFVNAHHVTCAKSLESAISLAKSLGKDKQLFLIGGGMLYNEAIEKDLVKRFCLTIVETELPDSPENAFINFPIFYNAKWDKKILGDAPADENNEFDSVFVDIWRKEDV